MGHAYIQLLATLLELSLQDERLSEAASIHQQLEQQLQDRQEALRQRHEAEQKVLRDSEEHS